ncbi:VanZ family protein [Armatimonas sp.]|uniref:VanZ family protein n=1 Tax=Armatimonas sp. TaxID=1872638 RepID=UPI0037526DF8
MRPFVRYTLPLLIWMSFIFMMSGDTGSTQHTRPLMRSILRRLAPSLAAQLTPTQVDRIDFNIRKTSHVLEYLLLALLAYRAARGGSPHFRSRHVLFPLVLGIGFAASDEWHQSFIPSRWGVAADVLYDSFGVTLGTLLSQWREQLQREKQSGPALKESEPAGSKSS